MARIPNNFIGINVTQPSALAAGSTTVYVPDYKLGHQIMCDSGLYVYGQANGAVAEGYLCKYVEGVWDFDTITSTESGSTQTPLGISVASGALADNQFGWFWRGLGQEFGFVTGAIATDTQLTTTASAGILGAGGDPVHNLFTNALSATALCSVRSAALLEVNTTITN